MSENAFLKRDREFSELLDNERGIDWLCMFHSHPHRIITTEFGCANYFRGKNTQPRELKSPELKKEFSVEEINKNFAKHCEIMRNDDRISLKTIAELKKIYGSQTASVGRDGIVELAKRSLDLQKPFYTDEFSAGEILDFLARAFLARRNSGAIPDSLARRDVFGPSRIPLSTPSARKLNMEALYRVASGISLSVELTGMLPSTLRCGEGEIASLGEIGIGTAMLALAEAILKYEDALVVKTSPAPPYLIDEGEMLRDDIFSSRFRAWRVHREDLDLFEIARLASLQTWTLKPALPV